MKLFAIVGPDGKEICTGIDENEAWWCFRVGHTNHSDEGYRCIELHTYDPSKQVVVDSAVCAAARDVLKARVSEYEGCLPTRFQEKEIHAAQELDKFLKAGEMK